MGFVDEFKEFALKGNAVDMAVGIIIGAAFGAIVNSLVKDIIMPPLGLLLGRVNFTDLFIALDGKVYPFACRCTGGWGSNDKLRTIHKHHNKLHNSGAGHIHRHKTHQRHDESTSTA